MGVSVFVFGDRVVFDVSSILVATEFGHFADFAFHTRNFAGLRRSKS